MNIYLSSPTIQQEEITVSEQAVLLQQASAPDGYIRALLHSEQISSLAVPGGSDGFRYSQSTDSSVFPGSSTSPSSTVRIGTQLLAALHISNAGAQIQPDYLCYAHQSSAIDPGELPVLHMLHEAGLKNCFPLAIGQQGSMATVGAIEILISLLHTGKSQQSILLAADAAWDPLRSIHAPTLYPYGGMGAACMLSGDPDRYRLYQVSYDLRSIEPAAPHHWSSAVYDQVTAETGRCMLRLATSPMSQEHADCHDEGSFFSKGRVCWILFHHISDSLLLWLESEIKGDLNSESRCSSLYGATTIHVYRRNMHPQLNLQCSDPLVSLYELEQSGSLRAGDRIRLIFASLDFGAAMLELSCE